jgi:hypothetical protein
VNNFFSEDAKKVRNEIAKRIFKNSSLNETACLKLSDIAIEVFTEYIHEIIKRNSKI